MLLALYITSAPLLIPLLITFTIGSKAGHVNLQATNVTNVSPGASAFSSKNGTFTARHIECDEILYGHDLDMASCLTAISTIDTTSPTFDIEKTWGRRATENFDVGLPQRYMGRKCLSASEIACLHFQRF